MGLRRDHRDVLHALAFGYLRHRAPERAIALLLLALRQVPADPALLTALALALLRARHPAEALDVIERAFERRRPSAAARILRSRALLALGRLPEARAEFQSYLAHRDAPHREVGA